MRRALTSASLILLATLLTGSANGAGPEVPPASSSSSDSIAEVSISAAGPEVVVAPAPEAVEGVLGYPASVAVHMLAAHGFTTLYVVNPEGEIVDMSDWDRHLTTDVAVDGDIAVVLTD